MNKSHPRIAPASHPDIGPGLGTIPYAKPPAGLRAPAGTHASAVKPFRTMRTSPPGQRTCTRHAALSGGSPRPPQREGAASTTLTGLWFGCLDSNQDYQVQSLASCRLDDSQEESVGIEPTWPLDRTALATRLPTLGCLPCCRDSAYSRGPARGGRSWRSAGGSNSHGVSPHHRVRTG